MSDGDDIVMRARAWPNTVERGPAVGVPVAFVIRPPRPGDQGYITSTWLATMRDAHEEMSRGAYYAEYGRLIDRVLDRDGTRCELAVDINDPDAIKGWIVWTPIPRAPVLHYVYVRRRFRRGGIATALALEAGIQFLGPKFVYTCDGPDAHVIRRWGGTFLSLQEFLA